MTIIHDYIDDAHIQQLHDFLTTRGWELSAHTGRDDRGRPDDPEPEWYFPPAFRGVAIHELGEISPAHLHCRLRGAHGPRIVIVTAGNFHGCDRHDVGEHDLPPVNAGLDLNRATAVLTPLEADASALDATDLVHCRFFGPCGENNYLF
ncbi:hypothetical protein ACIA5G_51885 [Amycolatopsis sp. NPDC051758]|uniref:hypothetical protein n=1 Tax=Amycolatopsis sp. NPDC051758 TaxID=3363935 RepID=UPI0037A72D61